MIPEERLEETRVTYVVESDGRFIIVENVPARVNVDTGEQFFSPATAARLQEIAWGSRTPERMVATPVFDFAA
jgi:hypothetical protein